MKNLISVVAVFALLSSLSPLSHAQAQESSWLQFNAADKNIITNNNVPVAVGLISTQSPDVLWKKAQLTTLANVTKNLYSSLGILWRIEGLVYQVTELPPSAALPGKWSEILMLSENTNSPLMETTVVFLYKGSPENINSGDVAICAGYLAGTYETQNSLGGTIEVLVIVGNYFEKPNHAIAVPRQ